MRLAALFLMSALATQVESGPKVGSKPEPLKVRIVVGDPMDKVIDVVAERKDRPTLVVFVRSDVWDRPMARFLRKLDQDVTTAGEDARVVAVWLTDDVAKAKQYLPRAQQSLQFTNTQLAVFEGVMAGPDGWGINADAHLTAVALKGGKVKACFGYRSVNDTNAPMVLKALMK